MVVVYKPKGSPALIAKLKAKHVPVTIVAKKQAEKEAKEKPLHKKLIKHKLRYIAGAVVVIVILVVGFIVFRRMRQRD